jgi:hypothetical protein
MGQNFDDYPDFQKIPGMPILLQHSVHEKILCCLNIAIQEFTWKKSGFLNKVLRPRSLRSLAPPTARGLAGITKIGSLVCLM